MKPFIVFVTTTSIVSLAACSPNGLDKQADTETPEPLPGKVEIAVVDESQVRQQPTLPVPLPAITVPAVTAPAVPMPPVPAMEAEQDAVSSSAPLTTQPRLAESKRRDAAKMSSQTFGFVAGVPTSIRSASEPVDRENYQHFDDNGIKLVAEAPLSTFSIDVDTGSYTNARRMLNNGNLPRQDAIRVEEFINYFSYPEKAVAQHATAHPFQVVTEVGPTPWNERTSLMRITLSAGALEKPAMSGSNLVFLVDVSGSMQSPDKLALLKKSLKMLTRQLDSKDKVSIVVYAGASGLVLDRADGNDTLKIEQALDELQAGGSTNGGAGIELAYRVARQAFIEGGNNRVILATDGDFNVGTVNQQALLDLIEQQRSSGVFLTTLGFGQGNYNDHLMEQLADHGNGNYAYIDSLMEAKKVLVDEIGATLQAVASDVKIQVEFNPSQVSEYRLVGYENRLLQREDFNNDKVDAGEIGAGHEVTALYEITLQGDQGSIDPLRYSAAAASKPAESVLNDRATRQADELAFVKLRYKPIGQANSQLMTYPVMLSSRQASLSQTSDNFRFASAVAAFGQKLRGSSYLGDYDYPQIQALAVAARGVDQHGLRGNFLQLVGLADSLDPTSLKPISIEPASIKPASIQPASIKSTAHTGHDG